MRRIITGTVAFALTLVVLGFGRPTSSLAAPETARAPFTAEALGGASGGVLGDRQPAVQLGGASGGVLVHIGEEIPQSV
jgi:hypothetical protein